MKTLKILSTALLVTFGMVYSYANNLTVTNAQRLNAGGARDEITFSISWENSWYVSGAPANHDAAWIFIKFRECGDFGEWNHAKLVTTSGAAGTNSAGGHTLGPNLVFARDVLTTDRRGNTYNGEHNTGAMVRRSTIGIGNIAAQVCTLKVLGTATNGVVFDPALEYDIKVFGIEMVQIPQSSFYLGDGSSYYTYSSTVSDLQPMYINAGEETQYTIRAHSQNLTYPDSMPIGYDELYCMKYEITQGQYVDFLNTMSGPQQNFRYFAYNSYGCYFTRAGNDASTTFPNRAIAYCSYDDMLTYLDWAALRPMNDIEFEKICRGPGVPKSNEYIWGSTPGDGDFVDADDVNYPAEGQMTCDDVGGNCNAYETGAITDYPGPTSYGVMDVGIFARDGSETRVSSGASYYGVMEMAGNAHEGCINMYYKRNSYTGVWGDGDIDANGLFDVTEWLGLVAGNYDIVAKGGCFNWSRGYNRFMISGRYDYTWQLGSGRGNNYQMRGVR